MERCQWAVSDPDVGAGLQKQVANAITAHVSPPLIPTSKPDALLPFAPNVARCRAVSVFSHSLLKLSIGPSAYVPPHPQLAITWQQVSIR